MNKIYPEMEELEFKKDFGISLNCATTEDWLFLFFKSEDGQIKVKAKAIHDGKGIELNGTMAPLAAVSVFGARCLDPESIMRQNEKRKQEEDMTKYRVEIQVRRNSEGYFMGDVSFFPAPVSEGHEIKTIYVAPKQMYTTKEEAAANALIEMGYRIARGPREEEVDKKLQAISDADEIEIVHDRI